MCQIKIYRKHSQEDNCSIHKEVIKKFRLSCVTFVTVDCQKNNFAWLPPHHNCFLGINKNQES